MFPFEIVNTIHSFTLPLALILGLWLAFPWIRRLAVYYPLPNPGGKSLNHVLLLLAWLALGRLVAGPFLDVSNIGLGVAIIALDLPQYGSPYEPEAPFGLTPMQFRILVEILETVVVYAFVAWMGVRLYRQGQLAFLDRVAAGRFERLLLLLGFAPLVNSFLGLVWGGVELGLANFMRQWVVLRMLIAWGVLAFMLLNLAISLARRLEPTELLEEEEPLENISSLY